VRQQKVPNVSGKANIAVEGIREGRGNQGETIPLELGN